MDPKSIDAQKRSLIHSDAFPLLPAWQDLTFTQCGIIFCSICALFLLIAIWGTRWGNRHLFLKSFWLSLFVHFCLALNWHTFSRVGAAGHVPFSASIENTELTTVMLLAEPSFEDELPRDSTGFPPEHSIPHQQSKTARRKALPSLDAPNAPAVSNSVRHLPLASVDLPTLRMETESSTTEPVSEIVRTETVIAETAPSTAVEESSSADTTTPEPPQASRREPFQRSRRAEGLTADLSTNVRSPEPSAQSRPVEKQSNRGSLLEDLSNFVPSNSPDSSDGILRDARIRTDLEAIPKRSSKGTFVVQGIVTHAKTGRPIAGATIRIDQASRPSFNAITNREGRYQISLTDLPDNFAITATGDQFIPVSKNVRRADWSVGKPRTDFQLRPKGANLVVVEENPAVHHLGDDRFEGRVNSRFQRDSEGEYVTLTFQISQNLRQLQRRFGTIQFLAKGIQCIPVIRINRRTLPDIDQLSPEDGSFTNFEVQFDTALLKHGINTIEFRATSCLADLDDFEFVNVQIRLE